MKWKQLFERHILDRGYDYYCDGAVEDLKVYKDVIHATVCGTEDYDVEITMRGDKITDLYCSCPYAESGETCKHMAAVLFEWSDIGEGKGTEEDEAHNRTDLSKVEQLDEIESIINQADDKLIRKYLSSILHKDEKLFSRFKTLVNPQISEVDMKRYKRQVDVTIGEYLGKNHFISYYDAMDFIGEMEEYLYEDVRVMLEDGRYLEAFELTSYIFIKVGNVDMDDSDGGTGMLADCCMKIWEEILDHADKDTEELIYKWFTEHLNGSVIDYMEDYIEQILMKCFTDKKFVEAKLNYTEAKVKEGKRNSESWSSNYQVAKWALRHINLLEESNASSESIEQYCRENWKYAEIRKYYISKCIEQKRYDDAIIVLEESLKLDADMPGLVRDFSTRLKEIYKLNGNQDAYRQQLWKLVTEDDAGNVQYYKELKDLYSFQEWERVREELFAKLPTHAHIDRLYKEEKMYERLLEYVLTTKGLYALWEYETVLQDKYPSELLQKYVEEVNQMATCTSDRKRYREWVAILRRMAQLEGGEEKVEQIVKQWREIYKNRRALMDELSKI